MQKRTTIAPLEPRDMCRRREAANVLARSFQASPNFASVIPDRQGRARALPNFFEALLNDAAPFGGVFAAHVAGRIAGVAVWYPPKTHRMTPRRQLRAVPPLLRTFMAAPGSFGQLSRLGGALDRRHPEEPHWYLAAVGVLDSFRGKGVGADLVAAGTARADAREHDCYLETFSDRHVRHYETHGFTTFDTSTEILPSGPQFWFMWRRAPQRSEQRSNEDRT